MRHLPAVILVLVAAPLASCTVDTALPPSTTIRCGAGDACPSGMTCWAGGVCRDLAGALGPRPIPATAVPLDLAAFPRPSAEVCLGRARTASVAPPMHIADVVGSADPGTAITIAPGTYEESPSERSALYVETRDLCLLAPSGGVTVRAAAGQQYGLFVAASGLVVDGLTFEGFATGVALSSGDPPATIGGVVLERVRIVGLTGDFREGIAAYDDRREEPGAPPASDGLLVLRSEIQGADLGISCNAGPCRHWWIELTTVGGRGGEGDSGADAIAVQSGEEVVVVDTTVSHAAGDGLDLQASRAVVLGARVLDVGRNGVKLAHGGDVLDTVVDGTGADAALVGLGGGRYRYANVLVAHHDEGGSGYVGTWAYDVPSEAVELEIVSSIFWKNATGGLFVPRAAELSIRRCLFDDGTAKLVDLGGPAPTATVSYGVRDLGSFEAAGYGSGSGVGDPELARPGARDYFTLPGSPARDRGELVPGLDRDLYGAPRVQGAGPDIGPVEQ